MNSSETQPATSIEDDVGNRMKIDGPLGVELAVIPTYRDLPGWTDRERLALFFHKTMKPYHDTLEDVKRALDYALSPENDGDGGFLVLAHRDEEILGGLLMLRTGMGGYVPANLLLFVATVPEMRGQGLGKAVCQFAIEQCHGSVKLHVEHDNPARRLYERLGFTSKYLEMRLDR
jgi:ribosomal-protein-alanine N-acetyltransferase